MPRSPGRFIKQNSVTDPNLLPIYELIGSLPNLPVGYAKRDDPTPLEQTFGLSQRPRLQDASNDLYQQALERLMRPRLILSLEQQIQKNIDDPTFVYEALKVYLMLGGKAPQVDKDLILELVRPRLGGRAFPGRAERRGAGAPAQASSRRCSTWTTGRRGRSRSTARWSSRRRRRSRACASRSAPTRC